MKLLKTSIYISIFVTMFALIGCTGSDSASPSQNEPAGMWKLVKISYKLPNGGDVSKSASEMGLYRIVNLEDNHKYIIISNGNGEETETKLGTWKYENGSLICTDADNYSDTIKIECRGHKLFSKENTETDPDNPIKYAAELEYKRYSLKD